MVSVRRRPWHPEQLTPAEWWVIDAVRPQVEARPEQPGGIAVVAWCARRPWNERGEPYEGAPKMGPLRQVSRTVSNIDRAVEWYGDELG